MDKKLGKYYKWFAVLICLTGFIVLAKCVTDNSIASFDSMIYKYISCFRCDFVTVFAKILTNLAGVIELIAACAMILIFVKPRRMGVIITLNLVWAVIVSQVLKRIFARPRPADIMLISSHGYSFPSGHATCSAAFYGFFIYLLWKSKLSKGKKLIGTAVLSAVILCICITRIYLGVHYASDILAGVLLAVVCIITYSSVANKYLPQASKEKE